MVEETRFGELAALCERLTATRGRIEKTELASRFLKRLRSDEASAAVLLLLGWVLPEDDARALSVGFAAVAKAREKRGQTRLATSPLTILKVDQFFKEIASATGPGSRQRKESLLQTLLNQASELESKWILKNIFGEMQHGVNEGLMLEALGKAAGVDSAVVRRANMFAGDLGRVASIALTEGGEGLRAISLSLFTPVKPMLAEISYSLEESLKEHGGTTAFEYKLDGARIQVHRRGDQVRVFTRRLTEVTESLPEAVDYAQEKVQADEFILDGEAVAVGENGKPLPFQDLMRRFKRIRGVEDAVKAIPLRLYFFDLLGLNGRALIDQPYEERYRLLAELCEDSSLPRRLVTNSVEMAQKLLQDALAEGHEGLMAKALNSPYTPGRRGKKWFKIKPADELDLVIAAADWGYGRRTGWLSNYHLAAFDPTSAEFLVVGKTFKGLTDEEFKQMTERLQQLKVSETGYTVYVKPSIVVQIAYNEIQKSPHYKSGFALRFARITRIREDKTPSESDTIQRIRALYEKQFEHKARLTDLDL